MTKRYNQPLESRLLYRITLTLRSEALEPTFRVATTITELLYLVRLSLSHPCRRSFVARSSLDYLKLCHWMVPLHAIITNRGHHKSQSSIVAREEIYILRTNKISGESNITNNHKPTTLFALLEISP